MPLWYDLCICNVKSIADKFLDIVCSVFDMSPGGVDMEMCMVVVVVKELYIGLLSRCCVAGPPVDSLKLL